MLHSLLMADADGWSIEAISPEPELLVNGVACRHQSLDDGDLLAIGPFRFRLVVGPAKLSAPMRRSFPRIAAQSQALPTLGPEVHEQPNWERT